MNPAGPMPSACWTTLPVAVPGPGTVAADDDRHLVVWTTASGVVCVADDRCPHTWSYLPIEGRVEGEELVCGAHEWRFDRSGRGTKVNVVGRRDRKGDLETFECRVRDGRVEALLDPERSGT